MTSFKLNRISPDSLVNNRRATLAAWRRFEPFVSLALQRHPRPYVFTPVTFTVSTFVSRIRDAIRGKIAFDYPSELSTETVSAWYSEVIIRPLNQSVYIGPRLALASEPLVTVLEKTTNLSFPTLSYEELNAFALLLSNGHLNGPIVVLQPPGEFTSVLPNLEILTRPDGSLVLL